ncbi:MAG: 50S ribosomal protein L9 [bacterium]
MRVYMLKDVEKVGMAGHIIEVSDGYAKNFLFPKKLAVNAAGAHAASYEKRVVKEKIEKQVLNSKMDMLAERIKTLHITIKERSHDDGKLYGSVGADEVLVHLKEKDISVNKKQIEFDKAIRNVGEHKVTVKLSSKLKPQFTLKVVAK